MLLTLTSKIQRALEENSLNLLAIQHVIKVDWLLVFTTKVGTIQSMTVVNQSAISDCLSIQQRHALNVKSCYDKYGNCKVPGPLTYLLESDLKLH